MLVTSGYKTKESLNLDLTVYGTLVQEVIDIAEFKELVKQEYLESRQKDLRARPTSLSGLVSSDYMTYAEELNLMEDEEEVFFDVEGTSSTVSEPYRFNSKRYNAKLEAEIASLERLIAKYGASEAEENLNTAQEVYGSVQEQAFMPVEIGVEEPETEENSESVGFGEFNAIDFMLGMDDEDDEEEVDLMAEPTEDIEEDGFFDNTPNFFNEEENNTVADEEIPWSNAFANMQNDDSEEDESVSVEYSSRDVDSDNFNIPENRELVGLVSSEDDSEEIEEEFFNTESSEQVNFVGEQNSDDEMDEDDDWDDVDGENAEEAERQVTELSDELEEFDEDDEEFDEDDDWGDDSDEEDDFEDESESEEVYENEDIDWVNWVAVEVEESEESEDDDEDEFDNWDDDSEEESEDDDEDDNWDDEDSEEESEESEDDDEDEFDNWNDEDSEEEPNEGNIEPVQQEEVPVVPTMQVDDVADDNEEFSDWADADNLFTESFPPPVPPQRAVQKPTQTVPPSPQKPAPKAVKPIQRATEPSTAKPTKSVPSPQEKQNSLDDIIRSVPRPVVQPPKEEPKQEEPTINRSAEPSDIRAFVRKHPHCTDAELEQYFTKKAINKARILGKIIKKGKTYQI